MTDKKSAKATKSSKKTTVKTKKEASTNKSAAKKSVDKKKTTAKKTAAKKVVAPSKKKKAATKVAKTTSKNVAVAAEATTKPAKVEAAKEEPPTSKKTATSKKKKKAPAKRRTLRLGSSSVAEAASAAVADAQGYVIINGRRVRTISTKNLNLGSKKKSKVSKAQETTEVLVKKTEAVKSKLAQKTVDEFREILLAKRAELIGDLTTIEAGALRSDGSGSSGVPIHMADLGSDTFDQDFALGLAESERTRLKEIDEALQRIEDGTYGVCQMTGKPIPRARLLAKPWAKYTIEAARQAEAGWSG